MDVAIDKNTRWPLVRLGDVCEFINGLWKGEKPPLQSVSVIRNANFEKDGSLDYSDVVTIDVEVSKFSKRKLKYGDIILEKSGGGPNQPVGRVVLFEKKEGDYSFSNFTSAIRVNNNVEIHFRYLYHFLRWVYSSGQTIEMQNNSTNIRNLDAEKYRNILIPLPSLAEQQRIVARLDAAFAAIAEASAAAEANLRNARALFDSYLDQVFSTRGAGWVERRLGDVGEIYDGPHATPRTVKEGPIFLGISALHDGELNLQETRHVTMDDFKKWTRRVLPQANDFVFSYETRLGQAAIIPTGLLCCLGRRMGLIRFNSELVNPHFFAYQYLSPLGKAYLSTKTIKGATVDRFSIKDFPDFIFVFPSIAIQNEIVFKIQQFNAHTAQLTAIYEQKFVALTELKQALLAEVFGV